MATVGKLIKLSVEQKPTQNLNFFLEPNNAKLAILGKSNHYLWILFLLENFHSFTFRDAPEQTFLFFSYGKMSFPPIIFSKILFVVQYNFLSEVWFGI